MGSSLTTSRESISAKAEKRALNNLNTANDSTRLALGNRLLLPPDRLITSRLQHMGTQIAAKTVKSYEQHELQEAIRRNHCAGVAKYMQCLY